MTTSKVGNDTNHVVLILTMIAFPCTVLSYKKRKHSQKTLVCCIFFHTMCCILDSEPVSPLSFSGVVERLILNLCLHGALTHQRLNKFCRDHNLQSATRGVLVSIVHHLFVDNNLFLAQRPSYPLYPLFMSTVGRFAGRGSW